MESFETVVEKGPESNGGGPMIDLTDDLQLGRRKSLVADDSPTPKKKVVSLIGQEVTEYRQLSKFSRTPRDLTMPHVNGTINAPVPKGAKKIIFKRAPGQKYTYGDACKLFFLILLLNYYLTNSPLSLRCRWRNPRRSNGWPQDPLGL